MDFRYTEAVVRRCSSEQVLLKISQCWSFLFNKVFNRCFSLKFAKSLRASLLQNTSGGCFWKYLMNSFFIAYDNDESCHCGPVIAWYVLALQHLFRFMACVSLLSISLFFFFFFVDFTTCLGIEVSLSILHQIKQWSCS